MINLLKRKSFLCLKQLFFCFKIKKFDYECGQPCIENQVCRLKKRLLKEESYLFLCLEEKVFF